MNEQLLSSAATLAALACASRPSLLGTSVRSLAPPPSNDFFVGSDGKIYQRIFEGDEPRRKQATQLQDPLSVTPCSRVACAILNAERVECWQESKPSETFALKVPSAAVSLAAPQFTPLMKGRDVTTPRSR